jgi:uncharacterized membrane-anchored protein YitT (DUF2179 family)
MNHFLHSIAQNLFLLLGVLSAGFGVESFLQPSGFIDGGVTGVSMLISSLSGVSLAVLIFFINLPFLTLGYFQIGRIFFLKSICSIGLLSFCLAFVHFPIITQDKLLTAVFGGMFLGAGIGLSIRGGGVLDGTEILALVLSRRGGMSVGQIVLTLNIVIFLCAAIFLGIEPALYSILTYLSASKTVDFLIHGIEEYYSLTIISSQSTSILRVLIDDLGRGVTRLRGRGGKSDDELDVLYCIATRLELSRIKSLVREQDENAFIVVAHVSDVLGGLVRKNAVHRLAG